MTEAVAEKTSLPLNASALQLSAIAALAAIADWLFYDRPLGISIAIFLTAVFAISAAANRRIETFRQTLEAFAIFIAGIAPAIYSLTILSFVFAVAGTALSVQMMAHPRASWAERIGHASNIFPDMIWRAVADCNRIWRERTQAKGGALLKNIVAWIVPVLLGAIFVSLFASANPIIDDWFGAIDWKAFFNHLSMPRIFFWILTIAAVWPLVFLRNRAAATINQKTKAKTDTAAETSELFGRTAILRSLVLFNILFVVQSALDIAYLWGGLELPRGMNYANYAHRGAYPLIVTALLAGAFVLIATRPGSDAERSPLIRKLVYLWTAQNVLLVISSVLRLALYIDVYSLTYWRVAAFIWMLLVAIGLILIVARLLLNRSSNWLVASNAVSLALVLYVCCFINFPLLVANYNIAHSKEVSGKGVALDTHYLLLLGPQVIPAIDRYLATAERARSRCIARQTDDMALQHLRRMGDWRAWTYLDWQLARYLRERNSAARGFTPMPN